MLDKLRQLKPNRQATMLLSAAGLGLTAALVARSYMSNRIEQLEADTKGPTIEVVVAKTDLQKGAVLSEETVAIRQVPQAYAHEQAILPENFNNAEGEVLAFSVKGGQMVLWPMLEEKRAPSFAHQVEVGRRAMTVPVDEINSISGMLEPGDMIDLLASLDRNGKKVTFPLLQNVKVLATGQRSQSDPKSGERRDYSTVTLDTTPEQAHQVIAVREQGRITALLRNPQDKTAIDKTSVNLEGLLADAPSAAAAPLAASGAAKAGVPILYGGQQAEFTPEQLNLGKGNPLMNALRAITQSATAQSTNTEPSRTTAPMPAAMQGSAQP
ncbi:Flp pilus assembly protein CpaB [Aquabacterium lacunae]|uniref:Flp pilus assembly protein CpaB n=1 Tax=Aquabacterium lacunae TaxID=2528630 RepID=A0A4Q9H587_9BURK|nr:Flp pilus assembly protein CpaB [Aquabacterium lacunae]TBO32924.1 Flp pilus assembly protein CpaB [Aquabacterium lacunae]